MKKKTLTQRTAEIYPEGTRDENNVLLGRSARRLSTRYKNAGFIPEMRTHTRKLTHKLPKK